VVIIRPDKEDSEFKSSEEVSDAVFTLVNPRKKGIQVTAILQISGNGLVVEKTNPEGLKTFTENEKLKEASLKASTPQRKHPRMIMYDVPRDISEKEILVCMKNQVLLWDGSQRSTGNELGNGRTPPPQVREQLLKGKVYISWNACKIRDYVAISRC
jgi:hypothetical protein